MCSSSNVRGITALLRIRSPVSHVHLYSLGQRWAISQRIGWHMHRRVTVSMRGAAQQPHYYLLINAAGRLRINAAPPCISTATGASAVSRGRRAARDLLRLLLAGTAGKVIDRAWSLHRDTIRTREPCVHAAADQLVRWQHPSRSIKAASLQRPWNSSRPLTTRLLLWMGSRPTTPTRQRGLARALAVRSERHSAAGQKSRGLGAERTTTVIISKIERQCTKFFFGHRVEP